MSYRFYPLSEHAPAGVLIRDEKQVSFAEFLTPKQAKSRVLQRHRNEELELLEKLQDEAQLRSALA